MFAGEAVGGVALVLGANAHLAVLARVPIARGATWAPPGAGWLFTNQGGGWEYPSFLSLVVHFLVGDGKFGLEPSPLAS